MTAKAESIRSKFTNEANELAMASRSTGGKMNEQVNADVLAMLGGVDFIGLEELTPVKAVAAAPKLELKPSNEPGTRFAAEAVASPVESVAAVKAPEPVREEIVQAPAANEVAEGHSFAHFFQRDEQPAQTSSIERFA